METDSDPLLDYLRTMDKIHQKIGYHQNNIAILLSIMLKKKGITQNQIQQLTKIPLGPISETLQILEQQKLISKVKLPNIREKYYTSMVSFGDFLLKNLNNLAESYDHVREKIIPIQHTLNNFLTWSPIIPQNPAVQRFFYVLQLYLELVKVSVGCIQEIYIQIMNHSDSKIDKIEILLNPKVINLEEIEDWGKLLDSQWRAFFDQFAQLPAKFLNAEQQTHFRKIKRNFYQHLTQITQDLGSVNLGVIILCFWVTGTELTQEQIAQEIGRSRSAISVDLKKLRQLKYVECKTQPHSHKKFYFISNSLINTFFLKWKVILLFSKSILQLTTQFEQKIKGLESRPLNAVDLNFTSIQELSQSIKIAYEEYDQINQLLYSRFAQKLQKVSIPSEISMILPD